MAFGSDRRYMSQTQADAALIDVGLRQYMLRVYNYMAAGLALTGVVAFVVASSPEALQLIFGTPLKWVILLAPLGLAFYMGARIQSMSVGTAQGVFWAFATLIGLMMSSYLVLYTGVSVARVFFITAASFAGLSLYGYTTKRSLSGFGSFLVMGLWGLIIAGFVNMFLHSAALYFVTSAVGVLIFAGLTAYDTQRIKEMYWEGHDGETSSKMAIMGALNLYLDFVNLFIFMLQFLGVRRD